MKEKLLCIVGPTAVGKTKMSISLAKRFDGEVISGDSMQVYRGMDIGTAKIKKEEMEGIPHHLIGILEPEENFSVSSFKQKALEKIREISLRQRLPILVGGTGLYVQAVTHDFHFAFPSDEQVRHKWEVIAREQGSETLYAELTKRDPEYARSLHPNNVRRVIRALEILDVSGRSMAEFQGQWENKSPYQLVMIGLTMEREKLYERINTRVDRMIKEGLVDEVASLMARGVPADATALQAIGYKEIVQYLQGHMGFEEAVERLKRNSRRFAKRQLTWFKRISDLVWFDVTDTSHWKDHEERIAQYVAGKFRSMTNIH